jgi:hypothetical protein
MFALASDLPFAPPECLFRYPSLAGSTTTMTKPKTREGTPPPDQAMVQTSAPTSEIVPSGHGRIWAGEHYF